MDLYFFTPVSFSPQYIEKKVSSGQPVRLETVIERIGSFLHICGPKIQVTDLSESGSLCYRVVKPEFSCIQSCMKILAYLLVIPVIIALVVKLITHILLLQKYQLKREESDHECIENDREIPQGPVAIHPITLVNTREEGAEETHTVISRDLLAVFRDNFPAVIGELLVEQNLSFEEFDEFMDHLKFLHSSLSLNTLSRCLREKITDFGMDRISAFFSSRDIELLSLIQDKFEDILLSYCPFLWLSNFCDVCALERNRFLLCPLPREAWQSRGSLSAYWVSRLGFSDESITIFSPVFWVVAEIISDTEYSYLVYHADLDTWEKNKEIVSSLFARYCQYVSHSRESALINLKLTEEHFAKYLLLLAKHGFSLRGVRLLRSLTLEQVLTLQDLTTGEKGNRLSRWMKSFGNAIYNPDNHYVVFLPFDCLDNREFSQALQILTWSELREHGVPQSDAEFSRYLSEICGYPIVISDPILWKAEKEVRKFNLTTGECLLTLQSGASTLPPLRWTNWARSVHTRRLHNV